MIENPMVLPKITFRPYYREPIRVGLTCDGCDKLAKYYVNGEPHCKSCMLEAIDSDEVRVRVI